MARVPCAEKRDMSIEKEMDGPVQKRYADQKRYVHREREGGMVFSWRACLAPFQDGSTGSWGGGGWGMNLEQQQQPPPQQQ